MAEEGFHEIQLNSKQLVFLFMATAVVAAIIFLSGVMVGRGVRAEKEPLNEASTLAAQAAESPAGGSGTQIPSASAAPSASPTPQSQAPGDELSYYSRLGAGGAPKETLKPASPTPTPPAADLRAKPAASAPPAAAKTASGPPSPGRPGAQPAPAAATPVSVPPSAGKPAAQPPSSAAKPAAQPAPSAPKQTAQPPDNTPKSPSQGTRPPLAAAAKGPATPPKTAASVPADATRTNAARTAEPAAGVFSVQVGAMRNRDGADTMVKELLAKGYDAYIVAPEGGSSLHRVRVGRHLERRAAEELKRRLEQEDYRPLITR